MGVHMSESISQERGRMSYVPLAAYSFAVSKSGIILIKKAPPKDKQKSPLTESVKDEQFTYPRCHLDSHCCALSRIPTYPRQLNVCHHVAEYFARRHLTAPSAVHLPYCFPPGSQPPGLSVGSYNGLISASSVSLVCMIHFFSAHVKGFGSKTSICTSRGAASKQNIAHFTNIP